MSAFNPRMCAAAIAPLLAVSGVLVTAWPAQAVSANVVISEVYGGGGNSGAPWKSDFVELYNGSDAAVDVSGWAVQYYSSGGDTDDNATDFRATEPTPENSIVEEPACSVTPALGDPETVAQIQDTSHTSPYSGKVVNGVHGVVTAVGPNGYWIQSTTRTATPPPARGCSSSPARLRSPSTPVTP